MTTSISTLHPPGESRFAALALKLNPEVLQHFQKLRQANLKPKLVVKDGKFSIKISESLIYPCSASPETLRLDVYTRSKAHGPEYSFTGTVTNRLNVLSDPKQMKEHSKASSLAEMPILSPFPEASAQNKRSHAQMTQVYASSVDSKAYCFGVNDTDQDRVTKFLSYIALGPMTRPTVEKKLLLPKYLKLAQIDSLFSAHTQPYLRKDTFTEDDVYPLLASVHAADITVQKEYVILKDKAYKELRPWQWHAYTDYERKLVLDNCNHALSRQGFSDTHPLRLRIVERTSPVRNIKKPASLGGGLLVSSTKKPLPQSSTPGPGSPVLKANSSGRASTESPKLNSEARKRFAEKGRKTAGSPLRKEDAPARSIQGTGLVFSSSSEDERHLKRDSANRAKRNSNSSTHSTSSVNSNTNSYTSPSSVNEEAQSDASDHDNKTSSSTKKSVTSSLPNRPSSTFTNHEKKQQYYSQLADKFRSSYKEYEQLHKKLSKDTRKNSHIEKKKSLMKLFELHNTLSEWKRRLWDYHNENNMAAGVMNLSKHRKSNSASKISVSAPSTSKMASTERFPAAMSGAGSRTDEGLRRQNLHEKPVPSRAKFALDY